MVGEELRSFLKRQGHNYKLILLKRSGFSLFNNLTVNYVNVYIRLPGASFVQLGFIGSIGGLVNAVISYPFGWLVDRYSGRKILIATLFAQALVPLTYFYARDWVLISVAIALSTLAYFCSRGVEDVVIANSLRDEDRATGFASITALSMIPNIVIPMVAGAIPGPAERLLRSKHQCPLPVGVHRAAPDIYLRERQTTGGRGPKPRLRQVPDR